jgi:hypothetical protein
MIERILKGVNYPAYKAGHLEKARRGIASPLPPLRIHPHPQDGVFCEIFIKRCRVSDSSGRQRFSVHEAF